VVFLHAAGILHMALARPSIYLYAPIYFVLLAGIGLFRQWGPPVLFTLGGFCIPFYWQLHGGVSSSYMENVMQDLIYPCIDAVVAGVLGIVVEQWFKLSAPVAGRETGAPERDEGGTMKDEG
jgi:hypothetical protein